mmetsp:Transcript_7169/g.14153  ORF Transcript_7169/g.14153 Transcript_7169/m.14153 type:complete len:140 (-) Transcript_7169:79-498(-)
MPKKRTVKVDCIMNVVKGNHHHFPLPPRWNWARVDEDSQSGTFLCVCVKTWLSNSVDEKRQATIAVAPYSTSSASTRLQCTFSGKILLMIYAYRWQSDNIPARKEKKKVAANVQSSVDERRVAKKFLRIHHVNGGGVYS